MAKKPVLVLLCLWFLFLSIAVRPERAEGYSPAEVDADLMEYDPETGLVSARENVRLSADDLEIEAGELTFDRENQVVTAGKGVNLTTSDLHLIGTGLKYKLAEKEGEVTDFAGSKGEIFFKGTTGKILGDQLLMEKSSFTRCSLAKPCLGIKAREVRFSGDTAFLKGGWLTIKEIPLLPLPPMRLKTDDAAAESGWPEIAVGYNSQAGLFIEGGLQNTVTDHTEFSLNAGIGTNNWQRVDGGLHWRKAGFLADAGYRWDIDSRGILYSILGYAHQGARLVGEYQRGLGGRLVEMKGFSTLLPITSYLNGEASLRSERLRASADKNNEGFLLEDETRTYRMCLRARLFSGLSLGLGMTRQEVGLQKKDSKGWYPEVSLQMQKRFRLAETWDLSTTASYLWNKDNGAWLSRQVELSKDLHCFEAVLGYDWIKEKYSFKMKVKW